MEEQLTRDLWRLDIPLPGSPLKNLNSYLIKGGEGQRDLLIDTGFHWEACLQALTKELEELDVEVDRMDVFLTHLHSDHAGLATEMKRKTNRIYISSVDGPGIVAAKDPKWEGWYDRFLKEGFSRDEIDEVRGYAPSQNGAAEELCEMVLLEDGDELIVGDHRLKCILTPGHTPGHMCLYEPREKWLFSGDHVLFHITPNICRWPIRKDSLGDYLESLKKVRDLPVELLLPAHREETGILSERVDELLAHHGRRIDNTIEVLAQSPGANAYEIAGEMKWRISCRNWEEFPLTQKLFAVGETLAHLDYLEQRGRVTKAEKDGVWIYDLVKDEKENGCGKPSGSRNGTIRLTTDRLVLRRYIPEDAEALHREFGAKEEMTRYSGWDPYATPEMARETVERFIAAYEEPDFYGWAIETEARLVGTIGAYDHDPATGSIEVGLSIARDCWGKGYATEALQRVLEYLTAEEGIQTVTAWCAAENVGSAKAMERAGMIRTGESPGALTVNGKTYTKLEYGFRNPLTMV